MPVRLRSRSLVLIVALGACSGTPSVSAPVDASGVTADVARVEPMDQGLDSDIASSRDQGGAADASADAGPFVDSGLDAWTPPGWGPVPPLCPSSEPFGDVGPGEFELVSATGGQVQGVGRLGQSAREVLFIGDPRSTREAILSTAIEFDADYRPRVVADLGVVFGLNVVSDFGLGQILFASAVRPPFDRPGCPEEVGRAVVALRVESRLESWIFEPLGCTHVNPDGETFADTDGDGLPEVVQGDSGARIHELQPDGSFVRLFVFPERVWRDPTFTRVSTFNAGLAAADLDGDGFDEVSFDSVFLEGPPNVYGRGALQIFEYDPAVGYVARHQEIAPFFLPYWQAKGDVDGDGRLELLYGGPAYDCKWLSLYHAIANDTYAVKWAGGFDDPDVGSTSDARMADTDGDGDDEVIVPLGCQIRVLEWNGDRLVQIAALPVPERCVDPEVFAADIDGDGAAELTVTTRWTSLEMLADPTGVSVWKRRVRR